MNDVLIWQLVDSAFPSGSFAHSFGLEAAWQSGEVTSDASLQQFVRASVRQAGYAALPLVTAAHRAPERIEELDAHAEAFLSNAVANRASRLQGRALLTASVRVWPSAGLTALDARVRALHGHYAPIAGAVMQALEVPLGVTHHLILFMTARGVLAAAVRLGIVGPYRAQRMQFECRHDLDAALERCVDLDLEDLAQTAPVLDVLQSTHDRLYSRLFQS
jgi:urease accessory protein